MKIIAKNKKAFFNYEILDKYHCGISLLGWEVKSIRNNKVNLANSFCYFKNNELFISNMHISPYMLLKCDENRSRKLLLKKSELKKIQSLKDTKSIAIIPLNIYWDRSFVKVTIGIAKGRKKHDKRIYIKERDSKKIDFKLK